MTNISLDDRMICGIADMFDIDGAAVWAGSIGNGHINDTFLVKCAGGRRYVLQRINSDVFGSPDGLMANMSAVTEFIAGKTSGPSGEGRCLRVIRTAAGDTYVRAYGGFWRMMNCIEDSYSCETVYDPKQFEEIGRAYGSFIHDLSDFPVDELSITIDRFHDTRWRYECLRKAVSLDSCGRAAGAHEEISFALKREKDAGILMEMAELGQLPIRVTHNDTKINNVMLDRVSGRAVCVVDLDTVMPGLAVTDFGDAIRSGASTGREDEPDAGSVRLDLEMYGSFARGFIGGLPEITDAEIDMLPVGAMLMTLECGVRFLTDYLEGDRYFKTDYPGQNLVRCRAQFALVRDMEDKWDAMKAMI